MDGQVRERCGVIVIHGVGETEAGWTGTYLLPKLESFAAHDRVRPGDPHYVYDPDMLRLRLPTRDCEIAIHVPDDATFGRLAAAAGMDALVREPGFRTAADRVANADALVAALTPVFATRPSGHWLEALAYLEIPSIPTYDRASGVYSVRDPASSDPRRTWTAFTRRWQIDEREIVVSELFWADLSKVGYTIPTRLAALVQLFLESPYVLGRAFLSDSRSGLLGAIRWLIGAANWLMRWPIAGLHVAIFLSAFAVIGLQQASEVGLVSFRSALAPTVAVSLIVIALAAYRTFAALVHRRVGLADLALSGTFASAILLAILLGAGAATGFGSEKLELPETYLLVGTIFLLIAWILWTVTTVLAVLLTMLVGLKRMLFGRRRGAPSLARPSAALGLTLLLGILWKFVLTVLGILVITVLVPGASQMQESCASGMSLAEFQTVGAPPRCALAVVKSLLLAVAVMNAVALILVVLAMGIVSGIRVGMKQLFARSARAGTLRLPRLIASPLLIAVLFAGALFNFAAFYSFAYSQFALGQRIRELISAFNVDSLAAATLGLIVFGFVLRRAIEISNGFVHIGRDLVDHQYDPDPASLATMLIPHASRFVDADGLPIRHMRRQRIQRRLESLISEVVRRQDADRIVFVAHSQGTVIMHDYLARAVAGQHDATRAPAIDVVTVGSPLTHLYRYYFREYDQAFEPAPDDLRLLARLDSWTNMWRIDDPIGNRVDMHPAIENVGLSPGGHLDYWREREVCARLWTLMTRSTGAGGSRSARR